MTPNQLTIAEARKGLLNKQFSSRELVLACLDRIKKFNSRLNVFLEIWEQDALSLADQIDQALSKHEDPGPLAGIPLALKDVLLVQGKEITAASRLLKGHRAAYTATAVARLEKAGAVFLGRTNMDEFAMGSSTENSAFGPTKNPWDTERVPGGSSGGSAAAVAADLCLGALGSDTGGSIRQPAALSGVVGLKPTYGRVSRYGLMAMASSLDQIGPLAKTVKDASLLLSVIEGDDPLDSTSLALTETTVPELIPEDIKGMRIGIPKEYFIPGMDSEVETMVRQAIQKLEELGAEIREVSLPRTEYALATYYVIMPSEVSANLARYDGVRFGCRATSASSLPELYTQSRGAGFGNEARRRIMLGAYALSSGYYDAYYKKAQQVRTLIADDFRQAFRQVECLVTPTSPIPAFKLGERFADPLTMYLADIFTVSVNLAGLPAISVPGGFAEREGKKLPIGLQFIGKQWGESTILRAAHVYEQATEWKKARPILL
ncbi:Asp-tRNA(Asn)/Glu-tRNA(Gln) amidotransferase subunit GatA [Candidatus Uhrbacteria bacterium]|nr:Asp-tRNA(Asn)/Glu-tRNA(Gln) amidotransferase subunit GatA [Candidatus Uhrbacteria bacterium]